MSLLAQRHIDKGSESNTGWSAERPRRRDHLRVVRPREGRRFRPGLLGSLVAGVVLVILFALAAIQTLLVQRQLEIDELQGQVTEQQVQRNRLMTNVAVLENPDRIVSAATELGLLRPESVVYLNPSSEPQPSATQPSEVPNRRASTQAQAQSP